MIKQKKGAIRRNIELYRWQETFQELQCPNLQVKALNEVLINIFPTRQAPWITKSIKNFIRKKNRAYKNFVKNGRPDRKLVNIENMITQSSKIIEEAKRQYYTKIGKSSQILKHGKKRYWSLINKILNKAKIPVIPPLLENDVFVLAFESKAQISNDYFVLQRTTIDTRSDFIQSTFIDRFLRLRGEITQYYTFLKPK